MSGKRKRQVNSRSDVSVKEEPSSPVPSTSDGPGSPCGSAVRKSGRQRTKSIRAPPEFTLSGITSPTSHVQNAPVVDSEKRKDGNRSGPTIKAHCTVSLKSIKSMIGDIKQEKVSNKGAERLSLPPPVKKTRSASGNADTNNTPTLGGRVMAYSMREISTTFESSGKSPNKEQVGPEITSHIKTRRKSAAQSVKKNVPTSPKSTRDEPILSTSDASPDDDSSAVSSGSKTGDSKQEESVPVETIPSPDVDAPPPEKVKRVYMTMAACNSIPSVSSEKIVASPPHVAEALDVQAVADESTEHITEEVVEESVETITESPENTSDAPANDGTMTSNDTPAEEPVSVPTSGTSSTSEVIPVAAESEMDLASTSDLLQEQSPVPGENQECKDIGVSETDEAIDVDEEEQTDVLTAELKKNNDEKSSDLFSMGGVVLSEDTLDCMARAEIDDDFLARLVSVTGVKPVLSESNTILLGSWEQLVDARIIIEKLVKKQGKLKKSDRHWTDNLPKIQPSDNINTSSVEKPDEPVISSHQIKKEKEATSEEGGARENESKPPTDTPGKKKQLMIKGSVRPETGNVKWIQMKPKPDGTEGWVEIPEGEVVKLLGLSATRDAVNKLKAQAGIGKPKEKIKVQTGRRVRPMPYWDGEITSQPPLAPRNLKQNQDDAAPATEASEEAEASGNPDVPSVSELARETLELVNCSSGVTENKDGNICDKEGNILMGSLPTTRQSAAYVPASQKMNMKPGRALCTLNPTRADNECDVCGFRSSFEGVRKHKRRHHPKVTYACKLCGKRYAIINDMRRHWRNHRGMPPITLPEMRESMHCELCGYKGNEMDLRDHIGSEHSGSEILCALCNQVFMSKPEMEQHVQREHVKKKQKADASAAARAVREATTGLLYLSAGIKTGRKPRPGGAKFKCIWCGSRFSQESSLRYHLKIRHINVKQYACDICGKIYVDERILKTHMKRLHLGEKRHFCDVCHRGFFERRQMEDHRKTHINEDTKRRFVCSFCGCEFFKQAHLKSHEKIHLTGGQSHCDICNRAYFHDNEVHRHKPPEGPVKCSLCGREYRYRRSLHFHLRKNHNVDPSDHMMICASQPAPADLQLAKIHEAGDNEVTVSTSLENRLAVAGDIGTIEYQIEDLEVNSAVGSLERNGEEDEGDNVVVYMCEMCHMLFTDMDELNAHFAKDHENIEEVQEVVPPPTVAPSLVDDTIVPESSDLLTSVAGVDGDIDGVSIKAEMDIGAGINGIEEMEIDEEQEVQYVILQNPEENVAADSTIVQYQIELPQ